LVFLRDKRYGCLRAPAKILRDFRIFPKITLDNARDFPIPGRDPVPDRENLSSQTDKCDLMPTGDRVFWDFFDRSLPSSTVIGIILGLAIIFTLTLVASMYILDFAGSGTFLVKVVGLTVTAAPDNQIQVTLIGGKDIDYLTLLEVYLNGILAEPVGLPDVYEAGTTILYRIPPGVGSGGYSIVVTGHFTDGNSLDVYTTLSPDVGR
jgi:hypothetical protein